MNRFLSVHQLCSDFHQEPAKVILAFAVADTPEEISMFITFNQLSISSSNQLSLQFWVLREFASKHFSHHLNLHAVRGRQAEVPVDWDEQRRLLGFARDPRWEVRK